MFDEIKEKQLKFLERGFDLNNDKNRFKRKQFYGDVLTHMIKPLNNSSSVLKSNQIKE